MKKNTMVLNLLGVILCGLSAPAAADFCGQTNNNCCEWSAGDGKFTLGADWLYWKVQQDGIIPGTVVVTDDTVTPATSVASTVRPKFKYDNGFRVNLGYELPCDCWDVNVAYTYIPANASTRNFVAATPSEAFEDFTTFSGKWNLNVNNVDLDIGRTVSFGECLNVRPHVGFRATWFDQKFRSSATALTDDVTTSIASVLKQKFQGYGVEAGLWSSYKFGYGISLVGHFGGSILYSKFNYNSTVATSTLVDEVLTLTDLDTASDSYFSATPSVDYFVGLQYADNFCDMLVKAHVGWEQHVLFNTNRLFLTHGNLSTQGLTLGLEVGF